MKPRKLEDLISEAQSIFPELDKQLNKKHPLFILANKIDWERFNKFDDFYNNKGRPALPNRVMVGLQYLKYLYNLSDDDILEQFCENVYFQYFCGFNVMQHRPPCDSTTIVKWRNRIKEKGCEEMFAETLAVAHEMKLFKIVDLQDTILDTTVQPKNIAHPTDAKLLHTARAYIVKECEDRDIKLKRNYKRKSKIILIKAARYFHAKQFKRGKRMVNKLRGFLRNVLNSAKDFLESQDLKFKSIFILANKILLQEKNTKNKIYSLHEPYVECIAKGKAHKTYEFGCKTSVLSTNKSNFIVGITALQGCPYDGHTLPTAMDQMCRITGTISKNTYVDKGYRGSKYPNSDLRIHISGTKRGKSKSILEKLKRRSAVEPIIGHLKFKHRLGRNFLKGILGDKINAILSGCGKNLRKITRMLLPKKKKYHFIELTT
jgi:IS5 family transposase